MSSSTERRASYAGLRLALELQHTNHNVLRDVQLGDQCASLVVQAPSEPRFVVQVDWVENPTADYKIDELKRLRLEALFLCPVYFAVGVGSNCKVLRVEEDLIPKLLPDMPGLELLVPDYPNCRSIVLESIDFRGDRFEAHLEKIDGQFVVRARWGGTGLVNGFEFRLDDIAGISLEEAAKLTAVRRLGNLAWLAVADNHWDEYQEALVRAGHLTHVI